MARTTQNKPTASGSDASSSMENLSPTGPGIRVRSFGPQFHRAGHTFTSNSRDILLDDLSEEQLAAIEGETMLSSQRVDMPLMTESDPVNASSGGDE